MPTNFKIYCDESDDAILARMVFTEGPLADAEILQLPRRAADAPASLAEFLEWERSDWLIVADERLVASVEFSRHGYTGDNGFQRFARLARASALGVPGIYMTPFSRSRLNELEEGRNSPRNVAPEMFAALIQAEADSGVPSLALRWPTDQNGEPLLLGASGAEATVRRLRDVTSLLATQAQSGTPDWSAVPTDLRAEMSAQAALPFRGSETRFTVPLPIDDIGDRSWLDSAIPRDYFGSGKADKILAWLALQGLDHRELVGPALATGDYPWRGSGRAQVLYLGYQWRPDPASGLIAFAGLLARAKKIPLIVVWPRVFRANGAERRDAMTALTRFKTRGDGPIYDLGLDLGVSADRLASFRNRVSVDPNQFGVFSSTSKVGRILADNADACVLGDSVIIPQ